MPHFLIAGTTGAGKIASLLFRFPPNELRLVLIDPKGVDLAVYNRLPHLVMPVVTAAEKDSSFTSMVARGNRMALPDICQCRRTKFDRLQCANKIKI
jgi:hypothetical protein